LVQICYFSFALGCEAMVQACTVLALAGVSGAQYMDPYTARYAVPSQYSAGYAMPSPYAAAYPMPSPYVQYAAPYVPPAAGIDFSMWPQYDPHTGATYTYRDLGLNYQENSAPESQETAPEPQAAQQAAPEAVQRAEPEAEERAQHQPEEHQQQSEEHQQQPEQHQQQPEQHQQQPEQHQQQPEERYEVPPPEPQYAEPQYAEPQYAEPQYAEPQYAEAQYAEAQAVAPTEGQVPVSKKGSSKVPWKTLTGASLAGAVPLVYSVVGGQ